MTLSKFTLRTFIKSVSVLSLDFTNFVYFPNYLAVSTETLCNITKTKSWVSIVTTQRKTNNCFLPIMIKPQGLNACVKADNKSHSLISAPQYQGTHSTEAGTHISSHTSCM